MGVWQVTNETQPYVGQWDAVMDSFWDGMCWVPAMDYLEAQKEKYDPKNSTISSGTPTTNVGCVTPASVLNIPTAKLLWPSIQAYYTQYYAAGLEVTSEPLYNPEEGPKAQDPWEALKSMF